MSRKRITRINVRIPKTDAVAPEIFTNSIRIGVESYVAGLISDLGLEFEVRASVDIADDIGLVINGENARLDASSPVDPDKVSGRVCFEIYRNRDLLIPLKRNSRAGPGSDDARRAQLLGNIASASMTEHYPASIRLYVNERWWGEWTEQQKKGLDITRLEEIQKRFIEQTGIPARAPEFGFDNRLAAREYHIKVNDVRLPKSQCSEDCADILRDAVETVMIEERAALFTRYTFANMVHPVEEQWPLLYRQVAKKPGLDVVYGLIYRLIEEGVHIVSIDRIFDILTRPPRTYEADDRAYIIFGPEAELALSAEPGKPMDVEDWTRLIRSNLKREISNQYARLDDMGRFGANHGMHVYLLNPDLESAVLRNNTAELEASVYDAILASTGVEPQLIVTSETIRRTIWRIVERRLPRVTVLSWQELSPDLNLTAIDRISLPVNLAALADPV
jgi:type III secretory pathway component EscV